MVKEVSDVVSEFNDFLEGTLNPLLPDGEKLLCADVTDTTLSKSGVGNYDLLIGPREVDGELQIGSGGFLPRKFKNSLFNYTQNNEDVNSVTFRVWIPKWVKDIYLS